MRLLLALVLLSGCASAPPLVAAGSSAASPVVIDGDASEWGASLLAVAGQPLTVGVRSDAEAVAVAVVMTDPTAIRQAIRRGLVIWLDAEGGKRRAFGVQFPAWDGDAGAPDETDLERIARGEAGTRRVAVTRGGERAVYALDGAPGLDVGTGFDRGSFVVELRVPLGGRDGLGVAPGATVGLGIETASAPRDDLRERTEARADRGASGTGRGSASAQRGIGADGETAQRARAEASRLGLWLRVALAE